MLKSSLSAVMEELIPPFEASLGSSFKITENQLRHDKLRDMYVIDTVAELILPRAYKSMEFKPSILVESSPQELLNKIVNEHFKSFQKTLWRAAEATVVTWEMAINQPDTGADSGKL